MPIAQLFERLKRGAPQYGAMAFFRGECGPPDLDGARWKVYVTDGRSGGIVQVELTGSRGGRSGMEIDPAVIEHATQQLALRFPAGVRAVCMVEESENVGPLRLRAADLFYSDRARRAA
jgi:hypothetical protein